MYLLIILSPSGGASNRDASCVYSIEKLPEVAKLPEVKYEGLQNFGEATDPPQAQPVSAYT